MEKSGFFNARKVGDTYDRTYLAEDFANYFMRFIGNGVFPNPSTGLQVLESDTPDMFVNLKTGYAFINGYTYANEGDKPFQVTVADGVLNRTDAVFIRWDRVNRAITGVYVAGQSSPDPVAPTPTRTADIWDLCVAIINVKAGSTKITQDMIEDTRMNKSLCGIVVNAVNEIDTTTLYLQVQKDLESFQNMSQAEFTAWFDSIKGQLSGDIATNLQLQLTNIMDGTSVPYSGISIYTHSKSGTVHELTGVGANGRVKLTDNIASGDTFTVNGEAVTAFMGTEDAVGSMAGADWSGKWATFTYDEQEKTLNFKGGGGLSTSDLTTATAEEVDVVKGKTFFAGEKTIKTGTLDIESATASEAYVLSGKTFYAGDKTIKTGTMPDNIGSSKAVAWGYNGTNLYMAFAHGHYPAETHWDKANTSEVYVPNANVASTIGLTAAKILKGNTILGISGSGVSTLQAGYSYRYMQKYDSKALAGSIFKKATSGKLAFAKAVSNLPMVIVAGGGDASGNTQTIKIGSRTIATTVGTLGTVKKVKVSASANEEITVDGDYNGSQWFLAVL